MTVIRSALLASTVVLSATSAFAETDGRDAQHGIYEVIRGDQQQLQEGRSATEAPARAQRVEESNQNAPANQDPFYFRHATQSNDTY